MMTKEMAGAIKKAVLDRKNILIVGNASSGKTTLANALLHEMAGCNDRVIIIEDTGELQCDVDNCVHLRTVEGLVDMRTLLKATLRSRPDRIIIGEARGGEALEILKSWNLGNPGGLATIHASGARQGLIRLEQLIQEVVPVVPRELIAEAVDMVIFIKRDGSSRKIENIAEVTGFNSKDGYLLNNINS
jgi:type IV secretion system protein TrbB